MTTKRLAYFFIILLVMLSISCNRKNKDIIPEDKFADVLVDIHLMDATLNNHYIRSKLKENKIDVYYYSLFEKHDITREQFEASVEYYVDNIKKYKNVYAEVTKKLSQMETAVQQ